MAAVSRWSDPTWSVKILQTVMVCIIWGIWCMSGVTIGMPLTITGGLLLLTLKAQLLASVVARVEAPGAIDSK
jgi:flagellar biosynthesis protein FliR